MKFKTISIEAKLQKSKEIKVTKMTTQFVLVPSNIFSLVTYIQPNEKEKKT